MLHGVEVPLIRRRTLEVPLQPASVGIDRKDRCDIQIVEMLGGLPLPDVLRPRRAVPGADVDQVGVGVVRHPIPDRSATAELPPFACPRLRSPGHRVVLERLGWISGRRVEAPDLAAGVDVERRQIAAVRGKLTAGVADEDLASRDSRRHGDRVRHGIGRDRHDRPEQLPRGRVERLEPAIEHRHDHLAFVQRDTAAVDAAAEPARSEPGDRAIHLRVVTPELLAGPGVDREDDAPVRDAVEDAVGHERRRLLRTASVADFVGPGQAQPVDVRGRNLGQRAIALFRIVTPDRQPFIGVLRRVPQRGIVDRAPLHRRGGPGGDRHAEKCRNQHAQSPSHRPPVAAVPFRRRMLACASTPRSGRG